MHPQTSRVDIAT